MNNRTHLRKPPFFVLICLASFFLVMMIFSIKQGRTLYIPLIVVGFFALIAYYALKKIKMNIFLRNKLIMFLIIFVIIGMIVSSVINNDFSVFVNAVGFF